MNATDEMIKDLIDSAGLIGDWTETTLHDDEARIKITGDVARRIRRANYEITVDRCMICGWDFRSEACPHSHDQNERAVEIVKVWDGII